jgi:hypothetical protein
LKTVCQRGLGSTLFYSKEVQYDFRSQSKLFRVYIAEGEPMPAIIEAFVEAQTPMEGTFSRVIPQDYGANVLVFVRTTGQARIKIVSSSFVERVEAA